MKRTSFGRATASTRHAFALHAMVAAPPARA